MKKRGESVANLVIFLLGMPILFVSVMVWVLSLRFAFWYYDSRLGEETADQSKADYRLIRINADSNENTSNTDYWFLQNDAIYHYSLPDGPLELVWECEEEQAIRNPWENGQEIYFRLEGKDYEDEGIWKMRYLGGEPKPVSEDGEAQHIDCLQKWRFRKGNLYSRNLTRIVGYHNKKIYLVRDYCIYTVDVQTGEEQELCRLWQDERKDRCDYLFDWQGDYLIVQRQDWESCEVYAVGVEE